jgi:hypothetical protein
MFRFGPSGLHHGPGLFGLLLLLLLLAVVVLGVVALVRTKNAPRAPLGGFPTGAPSGPPPVDPVLGELRLRYARGDIDWDEYVRRLTNLGYLVPTGPGMGQGVSGPQAEGPRP